MIERLKLVNYKRFLEEEFRFGKRLTMFYGPNSSGKSSILRALQILRKSWEDDSFMRLTPSGEHQSFGRFEHLMSVERDDDFVNFEVSTGPTTLSLTYEPVEREDGNFEPYGILDKFEVFSESYLLNDRHLFQSGSSGFYHGSYQNEDTFSVSIPKKVKDKLLKSTFGEKIRTYLLEKAKDSDGDVLVDPKTGLPIDSEENVEEELLFDSVELYVVNPLRIFERSSKLDQNLRFTLTSNQNGLALIDFECFFDELESDYFHTYYSFLRKEGLLDQDIGLLDHHDLEPLIHFINSIHQALQLVAYVGANLHQTVAIGPSRVDPSYAYKQHRGRDVGFHGEKFSSILMEESVEKRVNQSLARMQLPYQVEVRTVDAFEFGLPMHEVLLHSISKDSRGRVQLDEHGQVQISEDRQFRGLPDLGYGLSQLIPILTQYHHQATVDIVPKGTLTIEQPELHLHPSWQAELAHVFMVPPEEEPLVRDSSSEILETDTVSYRDRLRKFLSGSETGLFEDATNQRHRFPRTQVIVETHSEYFVERLKNLVREGYFDVSKLNNDIRLYALQVDNQKKTTTSKEITLNHSGAFRQLWPHGFFPRDILDLVEEDWEDSEDDSWEDI